MMQTPLLSFISQYLPHISTSIALLFIFLAYLYTPYWSLRLIPGPPTLLLFGHLPLFAKHGPRLFTILANRYGPIFRFHMGRQVIVILASPELCYEVGIKKFKSIHSRSVPPPIAGSPLHQKGLFFTSLAVRGYAKPKSSSRKEEADRESPEKLARCLPMPSSAKTISVSIPTSPLSAQDTPPSLVMRTTKTTFKCQPMTSTLSGALRCSMALSGCLEKLC